MVRGGTLVGEDEALASRTASNTASAASSGPGTIALIASMLSGTIAVSGDVSRTSPRILRSDA